MKNFWVKYQIKKWLVFTGWLALGIGSIALLAAAVHNKSVRKCTGLAISISGTGNNYFIDEKEIKKIISDYVGTDLIGMPVGEFKLKSIENELNKDIWVREAQLFFDNNELLKVKVEEREPIARVFTVGGNSFYIDSSLMMLPLSEKFSARIPVFTGFPTDLKVLYRKDSLLLKDIRNIGQLISNDPFLMAMIEQIDITAQREFEMIPKMGNQLIVFGDASNASEKFDKMRLFYRKVIPNCGWNKYSRICLQYKGQVIAKVKGKDDQKADSLRTLEIMRLIAIEAEQMANDSIQRFIQDSDKNTADLSMIQESVQREETADSWSAPFRENSEQNVKEQDPLTNVSPKKTKSNPAPMKNQPKKVIPPAPNKQTGTTPKAVMPANSNNKPMH